MEKLVQGGTYHQSVPEKYIFPVEERVTKLVHSCVSIPVIDLDGGNQLKTSQEIIRAGKEYGFFQVINHGVPDQVLNDMMCVAEEFFAMPAEDKVLYYSEDTQKFPRLSTSQGYCQEKILYWRNFLALLVHPTEQFMHLFPDKPANFRDILVKYASETKGLATRLLKLIAIGLGLDEDYFTGNLSNGVVRMVINNYPPCPDPSLTFGLPKHSDGNLLSLVLQWNILGLQVSYRGEWVGVDPIPNAYVVNFGMIMEALTNGMLKAVLHRAVTNSSVPRTSIFFSVVPTNDCKISPIQALVSEDQNPPLYKPFFFPEFFNAYTATEAIKEDTLGTFLLKK